MATRKIYERLQSIVENNMEGLEEDLMCLDPSERVKAITALMQYVLPKQQSVNLENQIEIEYKALGVLLENASEEAISAIALKMLDIKTREEEGAI